MDCELCIQDDDPKQTQQKQSYSDLMQIGDAIERLKVSLGTKESPARTCKEFSRSKPSLENGNTYCLMSLVWIASSFK